MPNIARGLDVLGTDCGHHLIRDFNTATAVEYVDYEAKVQDFILTFTAILYEALPFIVFGAIIAGIVEEMIPPKLLARLIPRNRVLAIAIGGFLGLPSPMCDCGILVIVRRLLRKGVPLGCCVCYLLAGPIINVVTLLSTRMAFSASQDGGGSSSANQFTGTQMMLLRAGLGYLVAFVTSLIVEWQYRKHGPERLLTPLAVPLKDNEFTANDEEAAENQTSKPWRKRLENIVETALHDFVDVMVFLILGALLAALSRQLIDREVLEGWAGKNPIPAILIMMGLAIALCICSQADAFVAAAYSTPPASKLAFLVLGPMLDFKLYSMYTRVFRPRLIWTIVSSVVLQVFTYAVITHYVWAWYFK